MLVKDTNIFFLERVAKGQFLYFRFKLIVLWKHSKAQLLICVNGEGYSLIYFTLPIAYIADYIICSEPLMG